MATFSRSLITGVIVLIVVNIIWWVFDLPNPRLDVFEFIRTLPGRLH